MLFWLSQSYWDIYGSSDWQQNGGGDTRGGTAAFSVSAMQECLLCRLRRLFTRKSTQLPRVFNDSIDNPKTCPLMNETATIESRLYLERRTVKYK
mmetsp:Transcript_26614/g.48149  ORF Transcript_26614/g.48149 Transcript_26614/m.48149 type:complete len:95 (-) Transcript_26614:2022-2306(-)